MNLFALSGLLIGLSSTAMSVWVFSKNPKNIVNRLWSIFCVSVAFWGFGGLAIGLAKDPDSALISWRVAYIGVILIPSLFYHFVVVFLGLPGRRILYAAYIASSLFLIANATSLLIPRTTLLFNELHFLFPPTIIYSFFVFFFFLMVIWSHAVIWRCLKETTDDLKRAQLKWFLMATVVGFSGGATCFLPSLGIEIYPYGNFTVPLYPLIMSYAIVKHRLMDITVVIKRTLFYSLLTISISLVYLIFVFVFHSIFLKEWRIASSFFINTSLILFIALTFKPLEIAVHKVIQRRFFKGTISEISEQKEKLQAELERAERLKSIGILAAGLAHEIKNPITSIRTFAEYLPKKYDDSEFREKFSRIVLQETDRIKNIVTDLLSFSKPSEPKKKACRISILLKDMADLLGNEIIRYGIKISCHFDDKDDAFVDPDQIKQALLNILMNAIDALKNSPVKELIINTGVNENSVVTTVRDTGCGISSDRLAHIFDPFFTDKEGGTGLGLAISYSLVQKNGGSISVSSHEGKGSIFQIIVPRCLKI